MVNDDRGACVIDDDLHARELGDVFESVSHRRLERLVVVVDPPAHVDRGVGAGPRAQRDAAVAGADVAGIVSGDSCRHEARSPSCLRGGGRCAAQTAWQR